MWHHSDDMNTDTYQDSDFEYIRCDAVVQLISSEHPLSRFLYKINLFVPVQRFKKGSKDT